MSTIRPRGESISSFQRTYVGHVGRQKPQCTQSSTSSMLRRLVVVEARSASRPRRRVDGIRCRRRRSPGLQVRGRVEALLDAAHEDERRVLGLIPRIEVRAHVGGRVEDDARRRREHLAHARDRRDELAGRGGGQRDPREAERGAADERRARDLRGDARVGELRRPARDAHDGAAVGAALRRALGRPQRLVVVDDAGVARPAVVEQLARRLRPAAPRRSPPKRASTAPRGAASQRTSSDCSSSVLRASALAAAASCSGSSVVGGRGRLRGAGAGAAGRRPRRSRRASRTSRRRAWRGRSRRRS